MLIRPLLQTWTLKSTLTLPPESTLAGLGESRGPLGIGNKDWGVKSGNRSGSSTLFQSAPTRELSTPRPSEMGDIPACLVTSTRPHVCSEQPSRL